MNEVMEMEAADIRKCRAIVMFGPATPSSGMRAGVFYQVTLDPKMVSPGGGFIRLGTHEGDEIHGWQRISGLTICEVLGEYVGDSVYPDADMKDEPLVMTKIKRPDEPVEVSESAPVEPLKEAPTVEASEK